MFKQLSGLDKGLYVGILVPLFAALTTPLWLNSHFLFPFITTKVLFFRILVEIAVCCYVLLAVRRPELRPRWTPVTIAVTVFFAIVTIAAVFGTNLGKSFWGNIERGEGLLTLYHVYAFFIILVHTIREKKLWDWVIHAAVLVSVVSVIYATFQFFGDSRVINTGGARLTSTIGNASFYAGYLVMNIILAVWMFIKNRSIGWRAYYAVVVLFELIILMGTETRGAFLGLLGAVIISSIIYAFLSPHRHSKKVATGVIVGLVLIAGVIYDQKDSDFVQGIGILRRVTGISFNDITTQSRLLTWDSSWQGLKDRPLLGYGVENYNVAFNKYFHPEIFRDAGSQIWFDRAHNIVLDIAVTSGIVGLLSYIAIFVVVIRVLYRHKKKTGDIASFALFTGFLSAYFIQNLFVFDVLATYISLYVFLALIAWIEHTDDPKNVKFPTSQSDAIAQIFPAITGGVVVVGIAMIVFFNIEPARANMLGVDALILNKQGNNTESFEVFRKAIDLDTNQTVEIRQRYAELVIGLAQQGNSESISKELNKAIVEIQKSIEEQPLNVQHHLFLMILYNASDQYDARRPDLVLALADKALKLSPTRPHIYFEIGQAYIAKGEVDKAVEAFEKAVELQPEALESRWNLTAAYYLTGQNEKAHEQLAYLEEHGYDLSDPSHLQKRISVLQMAKNWDEIIAIYKSLVAQNPDNANLLASLAQTYKEAGNNAKARETVERLRTLNPALSDQIDAFIQSLTSGVQGPASETLSQ